MTGQLGCAGEYAAQIHYQGGAILYADIPKLSLLRWGRVLDASSEGFISVPKVSLSPECCELLGKVDAWGHELSLFRDGNLVWQGPVYDIKEYKDRIEITARDVIAYLDRRLNNIGFDFTPTGVGAADVGTIFSSLVNNGLAADDPGILPYFTFELVGSLTQRKATVYQVVIGDELRDLARLNLDFTTMGRALIATKEKTASQYAGSPIVLTEDHFLGELEVNVAGSETATFAAVLGDGAIGASGSVNIFYGLIQRLVRAERVLDNPSAGLMAALIVDESNPTPVFVVIPQDGRLSYDAPVTIEQLVCGTRIDVYVGSYCRKVSMAAKLTRVAVEWAPSVGESVGISLVPLPTP